MARTSKGPRYYKSKQAWYGFFGSGKPLLLVKGPKKETEQEAKDKYEAEKAARKVEVAGDRNEVWSILNAYLLNCQDRLKLADMSASTYDIHLRHIKSFNERCGTIAVRNLRPQHINEWLASMQQERYSEHHKRFVKWGAGTVKQARDVLKTAFIWAVEEAGLISQNPFDRKGRGKKAKRQRRRPSKKKVAISDAEHELVLQQAKKRTKKDFYYLLQFLHATGARPAEIHQAKASEWNEEKKAFVIRAAPENRGRYKLWHLGEDRTVYIPMDLVPLARQLMAERPNGPIFRTESGQPWKNNTLCARFTSTKNAINGAAKERGELPPIRKEVTAYSYRHAFITRWVEQGKNLAVLCELLNTSEAMIRQQYSHLFERIETLRGSLDEFAQGRGGQPATQAAGQPALAS